MLGLELCYEAGVKIRLRWMKLAELRYCFEMVAEKGPHGAWSRIVWSGVQQSEVVYHVSIATSGGRGKQRRENVLEAVICQIANFSMSQRAFENANLRNWDNGLRNNQLRNMRYATKAYAAASTHLVHHSVKHELPVSPAPQGHRFVHVVYCVFDSGYRGYCKRREV